MVIHSDFKPDSHIQSFLESSSSVQTGFDSSISISEDLTYVVQPINEAQPENSLQTAIDTLINKPSALESVLEPVLEPVTQQPAPKPILDISNMDISDSDEEDEHIIHFDEPDLKLPSTQYIQHLPYTSSSQPNIVFHTNPEPQTINISPPHTLLLDSIVLKDVCENIFEDLKKLVKARNDPVHTEQYEEKWIAPKEVIDRVLCDLQRLSVEAHNQSLNKWFKDVINSMEAVQVNRNRMYISALYSS